MSKSMKTFRVLDTGFQIILQKAYGFLPCLQYYAEVISSPVSFQQWEWFLEIFANVLGRIWYFIIVFIFIFFLVKRLTLCSYSLMNYMSIWEDYLGLSPSVYWEHIEALSIRERANNFPFFLLLPWYGISLGIFLVCSANMHLMFPQTYVDFFLTLYKVSSHLLLKYIILFSTASVLCA